MEDKQWSEEAKLIMFEMMRELSSLKYCYRTTAICCYYGIMRKYNMKEPMEQPETIVDHILTVLKENCHAS